MGFAIPAALGAQLSKPTFRPLVIVGDGAFQMTGTELSRTIRNGLNPIVLELKNSGYGTIRPFIEGSFNDIENWDYTYVPQLLGTGRAIAVETEGDFETALRGALAETQHFVLIAAKLDKLDISPALTRLVKQVTKNLEGADSELSICISVFYLYLGRKCLKLRKTPTSVTPMDMTMSEKTRNQEELFIQLLEKADNSANPLRGTPDAISECDA